MDLAWFTWTVAEQDSGSDRSAFPESSKPGLPGSERAGLLGFYENKFGFGLDMDYLILQGWIFIK
jgi:hypothetical protein